jgi:hypothetical protein
MLSIGDKPLCSVLFTRCGKDCVKTRVRSLCTGRSLKQVSFGVAYSVDREVHATADQEVGVARSRGDQLQGLWFRSAAEVDEVYGADRALKEARTKALKLLD